MSASFEKRFWPGSRAAGKRLVPGLPGESPRWYTIVGVVGDVRDDGVGEDPPAMIYYPVVGLGGEYGDWTVRTMSVALRTSVAPASLAGPVREAVWGLDAELPVISIRTGDAIVADSTARTSYTLVLLGIAAGVALLLSSIGIYGVVSYVVSQRTREIGVRMALGASRAEVALLVVGQGMRMASLGVALGTLGAVAATRLMSALLFGVGSRDPVAFGAIAALLLAICALASFIPARRAASVSPVEALHYE